MSSKHLAVLLVGLMILGLSQLTFLMRDRLADVQKEDTSAREAAENAAAALINERNSLSTLRAGSHDLIMFLNAWEPYFSTMNTPESAELNISMRLKEAGLVTLAQRYELVPNRGDTNIPRIMRANLVIEDDYAATLNWLGGIESKLPTLRVSNLRLTKGQAGNDIRLEVVFEVPLVRPGST